MLRSIVSGKPFTCAFVEFTVQEDKSIPQPDQSQADQAKPQNLPNAPSSTKPSLGDLGFPAEQTQSNLQEQALLDKRTHMLKRLGS
jgi:hypothetical protein